METFQDYAYYYNAFYNDKDYVAEARTVDDILKKYGTGIKRIISLGCGTGKHDIALSNMGYRCCGIDISPNMINIARENSIQEKCNIKFEVADIRNYRTDKKYDAVISLFHVMSYQTKNEDIFQAFCSARDMLNISDRGGFLLFDVWYGPGVLTDKPCVRVKEVEDDKNRLIRIARPIMFEKENRVDVNYEVFVIDKETDKVQIINEVHSMRYYFRPELELLLEKAGFMLIDNLDCKTLEKTNFNSWTSYFIAKAV